jgi:hypothetical protein
MKIFFMLSIALITASLAQAEERKEKEVDVATLRASYPNLMPVRKFSTVDVVIIGSKKRLGIKEEELKEFVTQCYKQLFRGYDFEPEAAGESGATHGDFGTLNLTLETYPIALHVELKMGSVGNDRTWTTNELRVSTNNSLRDARLIKTSVATMMAKAAATLRRMQAK